MIESWLERWREGRIGWHEEGGNASLKRHWSAGGRRVLVPMCGKSVDMLWLEDRGNEVVGVELSDIAARAFFEENALRYTIRQGKLPAYVAEDRDITIYCGDLFDFDEPGHTGWYDRGALVATPAEQRPDYARHIDALLSVFSEYGLESPGNGWIGRVPRYESVTSACAAAVQAEIDNAELYERIMKSTKRSRILTVFQNLHAASQQRHLSAFQRCEQRGSDCGET